MPGITPDAHDQLWETNAALMRSGEVFTDDFERYQAILDAATPVLQRFDITTTPPGFAPEEIRRDWVGLSLPVRFTINIESIPEVPVMATEALQALKMAGRLLAHEWWQSYYAEIARRDLPHVDHEGHPAYLANVSILAFDPSCGTLKEDPSIFQNELLAGLADPYYWWRPQPIWRPGDVVED